jgi:sporadic carbohydrate cluster 2OG-Fe(II) oxygenase
MTLSEEFITNGIVKIPVEDMTILGYFKHLVGEPFGAINAYRLEKIKHLNENPEAKKWYFSLAKNALHELVGNELVMQRNINLSIQLPGDDSSLLPIHADVLQGDSPYEVVLWVPLVDCYDSKSMFFTRKQPTTLVGKTLDDLYAECDPYFVDCKYGECLIFSQNWFHGNRVNETNETRWSMNCRFKSALTPYGDKKLGEFFEPIEIRAATRMGAAYEYTLL